MSGDMAISRRALIGGTGAAALTASMPAIAAPRTGKRPVDWVDPFIGTGGHGHTYPGATRPFGMVQLSPDTDNARWDACSGYHHDDTTMLGFSHTHLSGTGVGDLMDVLLVPRTGPIILDPGSLERPEGSYRQRFVHTDERARPGYYAVRFPDSGIAAELTVTDRVGYHRYRFPGSGHILVDLAHGARDEPDPASIGFDPPRPTPVSDASLRLIGRDTLVGSRRVQQWANGRVIHFALRVSRPFAEARFFSNDRAVAPTGEGVSGASLKAALLFPDAATGPIVVRVALSGVDVDGALANLTANGASEDFDRVVREADAAWDVALDGLSIEGASEAEERIFYTAAYHAMLAPTLFSDSDGRYRGMDTAVHRLSDGDHNYSTYSLWDSYRTLHPLLGLIRPERNADLVRGLARMTLETPAGPPVWPLQGIETHCMIGWHSAVVIAEGLVKGVPGLDAAAIWPAIRELAFHSEARGLRPYRELGYIPSDKVGEAASKTLEYAYDDWAMAVIAERAGASGDAARLRARSRNYRNLFDHKTGFIRPRLADGTWAEPFDPRALGHDTAHWRDFTECNAWQATFLNQHDVYGLIDLFGGDAAFEAKLDALFAADSSLPKDAPPDVSGLVGQYAHGNEPSHHVAYLYAYCGVPWKTQARVRMLLEGQYRAAPDGLSGNEDCGQMSAWYVMSALGLYPVDPVSGAYVFGAPLHPRATVPVGRGRSLVVEAPGISADAVYVQRVSWNGQPWTRSWIGHGELVKGGRLIFQMGSRPNPAFGRDPADRPPSFGMVGRSA
ncbi:putative alpha-1,2-mannosidase [Sphingomonas parapaucimobilis NBRC 15100]|jgi:predicted alpha-1,2-mannosidase|uniref:Putative alpha-1,2-mannosidase n=2 Tax=Sphingomonas parapaucimobilis TaxID=28213 RepID=A0A0A1WBC1_9SPHN|nr:putative alpha-1,2-mannosidase [Sphingomonas parapaucimobilis NBRC 15100]